MIRKEKMEHGSIKNRSSIYYIQTQTLRDTFPSENEPKSIDNFTELLQDGG